MGLSRTDEQYQLSCTYVPANPLVFRTTSIPHRTNVSLSFIPSAVRLPLLIRDAAKGALCGRKESGHSCFHENMNVHFPSLPILGVYTSRGIVAYRSTAPWIAFKTRSFGSGQVGKADTMY